MKLKGELSIGRYSSTDTMHIELIDESSSITFLSVEIDCKDLMLALTGLGNVDCSFELRNTKLIGKKLETKTEEIFCAYPADEEDIYKALKPLLKDGWMARREDFSNHHNIVRGSVKDDKATYRVSFHRYV